MHRLFGVHSAQFETMLIIRNVRVNPRYIKPKYGKGFFGSFAKLMSKTMSRVAKNKALRKGINAAIAGGKNALTNAAVSGKQLLKDGMKEGYLKKGIEAAVDIGTQLAVNQLNKGIDFSADALRNSIDKNLSKDSTLHLLSNSIVDSVKDKAKEVGRQSTNRLSDEILKRAVSGNKSDDKKATSNKSIQRITSDKVKQQGMQSTSRIGKKRSRATAGKKAGVSKRKKRIDWNDVSLNSLIAKQ